MQKNMRHPAFTVVFSLVLISFFIGSVSSFTEHHPQYSYDHDPKHFVLVHGACLGAWSWYKLIPALQSYGHNVTAIDLAASGINLVPVNDIRTFSDYSKPLIDFMGSISSMERVILVGHSLGGAAISQAMELFPEKVSVGVFLTAVMPGPSLPFSEILQQDVALANVLVRTLRITTGEELVFTKAKYGSVNRVFIISERDRVLPKQFQESMIERNPPNRVEIIFGSDHMVMTSQPAQLLVHLLGIARDFS